MVNKIEERQLFCFEHDAGYALLENNPNLDYSEFEEEKLQELEEYLAEIYSPDDDSVDEDLVELSDFFDRPNKLRFLQANKYKIKQTAENMVLHQEFRNDMLPFKINEGMEKVLNSGLMYVHGRDK